MEPIQRTVTKVVGLVLGMLCFAAGLLFWITADLVRTAWHHYHPSGGEHVVFHDGDGVILAGFVAAAVVFHLACLGAWVFFRRKAKLLSLGRGSWEFVMVIAYAAGHVMGSQAAHYLDKLAST